MSNSHSLVLYPPTGAAGPYLVPAGGLGLPTVVYTAALAVPFGSELRLLINNPGAAQTVQYAVLPTHALTALAPLPVIAVGAAQCGNVLLITGSDQHGHARMAAATPGGDVAWQSELPGPPYMRWPQPGCAGRPVVAWQSRQDRLDLVYCGPDGIQPGAAIAVGGPPLAVALAGDTVWAAWLEPGRLKVAAAVIAGDTRSAKIAVGRTSRVAIAGSTSGAGLAWSEGGLAYFARIARRDLQIEEPIELDLAPAAGGPLVVLWGPEPLVWAQRAEATEGAPPRWTSVLLLPGGPPLLIEGLVHSVAWWGETVVVVGSEEVRFLRSSRA